MVLLLVAGPTLGQDRLTLIKEAALGAMLATDLRKQARILDNDEAITYVNRVAQGIASQFPQYEHASSDEQDADWGVYAGLLYPSDLDMQSIQNRRLVDLMTRSGDDVTAPRKIDHWLYFPSEESRDRFIDQVAGEGFDFERLEAPHPKSDDADGDASAEYPFGLHLIRIDRPDLQFIDPLVADLFIRAQDCGGIYDGWGSTPGGAESSQG